MATIAHTPVTELEAINAMLASVGDAPVNSLTANYVNLDLARQTLHNVNRSVQGEGWWFNTGYGVTHTANLGGEIVLGANVLNVKVSRNDTVGNYIMRDGKLFDNTNNTFSIPTAILDVVQMLPFEDIPDVAREFIMAKAIVKYRDIILDIDRESLTAEQADIERTRNSLEIAEILNNKYWLNKANEDFQSIGWSFNTRTKVTLTPDNNGVITLTPDVLAVQPWPVSRVRVSMRGTTLWNLDSETGVFTSPIIADVIYKLPYSSLSYTARLYVEILSQKHLQPSKSKAAGLHTYTQFDEQNALVAFKMEDLRSRATNRLTHNYSTFAVLDRRL